MWVWIKDRFLNLDTGSYVRIRPATEEGDINNRPKPDVIVRAGNGYSETYTLKEAETLLVHLYSKLTEDLQPDNTFHFAQMVMADESREALMSAGILKLEWDEEENEQS